MLPREVRSRMPVKKSKYHIRRPPKCKYCDKDAKRNEQPDGRNKGYYRTCGDSVCLCMRHHDQAVQARKQPINVKRICEKCGLEFSIKGWSQRWCSICVPSKGARGRMQRYGVSDPEFREMVEAQNGICAICKFRPAIDLDHCHKTNKIRKVLCSKCNLGLHFVEDVEWLEKAKQYAVSESGSSGLL